MNSADLDDFGFTEQLTDAVKYAIEQINALPVEFRHKAVAMLVANYNLSLKDPPVARPGNGYGPRKYPKRRYAS